MRLFYSIKLLLILEFTFTYYACYASCVGPNWTFYEYTNNRNKNEMLFYGQVIEYEKVDNQYLVSFTILEWFYESRSIKQIKIFMPLTKCEINSKWLIRPHWNEFTKRYHAGGNCDFVTSQITTDNQDVQNKLSTLRLISQIHLNKLDTFVVLKNHDQDIVAEGVYKNGLPNGVWNYYVNNKLKSKYTYNKGVYIVEREYYSNGYPKFYRNEKRNYQLNYFATDSSAIKTEYVTFGRKKIPKTRLGNFYKSKMKITNYYSNGTISDVSFQVNYRVKDGANGYVYKIIEYHDSGRIKSIKRFKHDKKVGIWKYYDDYGKLERKEIWSKSINK